MMMTTALAKAIHEDRISEAREMSRDAELARLRKASRAEARARRRRLRHMRKDAHRATLGAFVAFGDGVAGSPAAHGSLNAPTDAARSGARAAK